MSRSRVTTSMTPRSARTGSTTTIDGQVGLPPRQPIAHAFTIEGLTALGALSKSKHLDEIETLHKDAIDLLTECAVELQDLAKMRKARQQKEKENAAKNRVEKSRPRSRSRTIGTVKVEPGSRVESQMEDVEMQDDEEDEVSEADSSQPDEADTFPEKVSEMTTSLDLHLRKLLDGTHELSESRKIMSAIHIQCQKNRLDSQSGTTFSNSTPVINFSQRASQAVDSQALNSSVTAPGETQVPGSRPSLVQPAEEFQQRMKTVKEQYQMMSLKARYSDHKHYIEFKQSVWDAIHGPEKPLPHKNTWFPEDDMRASPLPGNIAHDGLSGQTQEDNSDDDIQTIRVTISTKCPITFLELKNPISSKQCPHVFEKASIEEFIRSRRMANQQNRRRGQPIGNPKCPVSGCDKEIGLDDLYVNNVVVRKIKRVQEYKQRERDMDDENESGRSGGGEFEEVDDDDEDADDYGP